MKALVITAYISKSEYIELENDFDMVICADGGYERAKELEIAADYIIGDYDSASSPPSSEDGNTIFLPTEKDMTDTEAALTLAIEKGATDITIAGGLGGRFDHTMGNIGILAGYNSEKIKVSIMDGQNHVAMLNPGSHTIKKGIYKYVGIISYGETARGVTLTGFKYPLRGFDLKNNTSLGVSNEITGKQGTIEFEEGRLLVIRSRDL